MSGRLRRLWAALSSDGGQTFPDLSERDREIVALAKRESMTSIPRLVSLIDAVRYIVRAQIPGALAECGVWRGGSMMAVASTLVQEGDTSRHLYLYDTFSGMPPSGGEDLDCSGAAAADIDMRDRVEGSWLAVSPDIVKGNISLTDYPLERVHFVRGRVEETVPEESPDQLALLRLDTDYYASTRHELEHLYPLLACGGVLIVDDYGHWLGARKAVDEYFKKYARPPFFHRVDYTARLMIKP